MSIMHDPMTATSTFGDPLIFANLKRVKDSISDFLQQTRVYSRFTYTIFAYCTAKLKIRSGETVQLIG